MRISSGIARGFALKSPKSDHTRPATDASRLALFSSLAGMFENAKVLDLFAGTGSYGLEALSHLASEVTFVEKDKFALACLRENAQGIKKYIKEANIKIYPIDCFKFKSQEPFDLIFLDPPYAFLKDNAKAITDLIESLANENTIIVLEAPYEFELPICSLELIKRLGKKSNGKPTEMIIKLSKK